jgi:hypothetical protein
MVSLMSVLCGVTLSSSVKGNIQKVGFYDIDNNTFHKISIVKSKGFLKAFNLKIGDSKYNLLINIFTDYNLNRFKSEHVYIFPINNELFKKLNGVKGVDSLNYRDIAKKFGIDEWTI